MNFDFLRKKLREDLLAYRQEKSHLSLRAIERKSGVKRYFLTKLLDEESSSSLALDEFLKLSKYLSFRLNFKTVGVEFGVIDFIQKFFADKQDTSESSGLEPYDKLNLYNEDIYFVLVLASYKKGSPKSLVVDILGKKAEPILQNLLESQHIIEKESRIYLQNNMQDFTNSIALLKHQVPQYARHYMMHRAGQERNCFHLFSEGVTLDCLKKLHEAHVEFMNKIYKIISNPDNLGDIPCFSFACLDTFIENINFGNNFETRQS